MYIYNENHSVLAFSDHAFNLNYHSESCVQIRSFESKVPSPNQALSYVMYSLVPYFIYKYTKNSYAICHMYIHMSAHKIAIIHLN